MISKEKPSDSTGVCWRFESFIFCKEIELGYLVISVLARTHSSYLRTLYYMTTTYFQIFPIDANRLIKIMSEEQKNESHVCLF